MSQWKNVNCGSEWWCKSKETHSESGCRVDLIYGNKGIGSPHAHIGIFNGNPVYKRHLE